MATTLGAHDASGRTLSLLWPDRAHLPHYAGALERGWSPDTIRGVAAAQEQLRQIAADPDAFLASRVDPEARAGPITLPDGSRVTRLPSYQRWLWDGEFCGSISLRWQRGTEALPPTCLGHIGYSVVPWKQGRGYATQALRLLLLEAKSLGLRYVEITTKVVNVASQKVIEANGGTLMEHFLEPETLGGREALRYRVVLS